MMINDAYDILSATIYYEQGRSAFIGHRGVQSLCEVCVKQTFQFERALDLLLDLLSLSGHECWNYHRGTEDFQRLMDKLSLEFEQTQVIKAMILC